MTTSWYRKIAGHCKENINCLPRVWDPVDKENYYKFIYLFKLREFIELYMYKNSSINSLIYEKFTSVIEYKIVEIYEVLDFYYSQIFHYFSLSRIF